MGDHEHPNGRNWGEFAAERRPKVQKGSKYVYLDIKKVRGVFTGEASLRWGCLKSSRGGDRRVEERGGGNKEGNSHSGFKQATAVPGRLWIGCGRKKAAVK